MNAEVVQPFTRLTLSARLTSELADVHSRLSASAQRSRSGVLIRAGGEIDAFNEELWRRLIDEGANAVRSPGSFIVDLNGMGFMGSCAFRILADQALRCRRRNVVLRLVSTAPRVTRFIAVCGYRDTLPVHPTTSAAVAASL